MNLGCRVVENRRRKSCRPTVREPVKASEAARSFRAEKSRRRRGRCDRSVEKSVRASVDRLLAARERVEVRLMRRELEADGRVRGEVLCVLHARGAKNLLASMSQQRSVTCMMTPV